MSKSVEGSYINITDTEDEVRKKVRSIPTSSEVGGEMTQGLKTLFTFAKLYLPNEVKKFESAYKEGQLRYVEMKDAIADAISKDLKPMQEKRAELINNASYIDQVLTEGKEKARLIGNQTIAEVKERMGLK